MNKWILAAAVSATLVGAGAWAMAGEGIEALLAKEQLGRMLDARSPSKADMAAAKFDKRLAAQTAREARLDVGDPDSFGRDVRWLGALSMGGIRLGDCTPLEGEPPDPFCMQVDPASTSTQFAEFRDMARMTLPAHSMNSMLCHWLSPTVTATLANDSGIDGRVARLLVLPSLTIENAVLNAPGLVDPDTGLPLDGKAEVFINSSRVSALLDNGERLPQQFNSSRTCVGGYLSKQALQSTYGLSEAQSTQFFRNPTTVRLNLQVFADHVGDGSVSYGVRFVGD
jgi:hypothetical protein